VRVSDQPRYNLEMALLRLMHLRKLVPLSDLLSGGARTPLPNVTRVAAVPSIAKPQAPSPKPSTFAKATVDKQAASPQSADTGFKDRFLGEVKSGKSTFYNLVVASAFRIDATAAGVVFTFLPNQKNAKSQCDEQKAWLASIAEKVAGKPVPVSIAVASAPEQPAATSASAREPSSELRHDGPGQKASPEELKAEAMANSTVQAVLEIFPVDKTTIEEH
jgi:hypothetical protein